MAAIHSTPKHPCFKNLTDQIFGSLTVIAYSKPQPPSRANWLCQCICGQTRKVAGTLLHRGLVTQCLNCQLLLVKPETKQCRECKRTYPYTSEFFAQSLQHKYGLRARCRTCTNATAGVDARDYVRKLRLEVYTHYSNGIPHCACCNETVLEFLSIDHINGQGGKDRKKYGNACNFLCSIRRRGFPKDLQVLCHNCNQCKRVYGYCVHQPPDGLTEFFPLYPQQRQLKPLLFDSPPHTQACIHCRRIFPTDHKHFNKHPLMASGFIRSCRDCFRESNNLSVRLRRIREKKDVFSHYCRGTPHCLCCGNSTFEFLSIDHINNNGSQHRKEIKQVSIYKWSIDNAYPDFLTVLCYSCNQAKGFYGVCPHKKRCTLDQ